MYYEIAIDTRISDCRSHGGTACVISGFPLGHVGVGCHDSHGAHLVGPMFAFATLAMANWGIASVADAPPGSHVDLHLPASIGALVVDAIRNTVNADALAAFTAGLSGLRRRGIEVRLTHLSDAEASLRREATDLAYHAMDLRAAAEAELDVFGI